MPTLSIIIPAYNEEPVLGSLLEALSRQTLQPMEVIVADANSTDRTREMALQAGARVVDGGLPGPGRNRGAEVAKGEWLLFLDADAVLPDEGFLERALHEMELRDLGIACPDIASTRGMRANVFFWIYCRFVRMTVRRNPHAIGTCIFIRRVLHEQLEGFDETIFYAEDNDYGRRAARLASFGYLHECIKTPPRRFEKDGYLHSAVMNILAELYIRFRGPIRTDVFRYRFGYSKKKSQ